MIVQGDIPYTAPDFRYIPYEPQEEIALEIVSELPTFGDRDAVIVW